MSIYPLGRLAILTGVTIAIGIPAVAIAGSARPTTESTESIQIAQTFDTNCRQTIAVTGVYQDPDPFSFSPGVLSAGETVRLEVVGTGTGWSRVREPIVGWVESRFLTPPTPCTSGTGTEPSPAPAVQLEPSTSPTGSIVTNPQPAPLSTNLPVCLVQAFGKLTVLSPTPSDPPLPNVGFISGERVAFQFTGETQSVGRGNQIVARILAPAAGWITVRDVDGSSTLSGNGCPQFF